jgi:hypothetical protein
MESSFQILVSERLNLLTTFSTNSPDGTLEITLANGILLTEKILTQHTKQSYSDL